MRTLLLKLPITWTSLPSKMGFFDKIIYLFKNLTWDEYKAAANVIKKGVELKFK